MSPGPLSRKRCTTDGTATRRWIVATLVLAMSGFVGFVAADGGNAPRLVPKPGTKASRPGIVVVDGDAAGGATSTSVETESRSASSPLAPSNDDCSGAIVIPAISFPVLTAPVNIASATPAAGGVDPAISCADTEHTIWYSFTPDVTGQYTFSTCNGVTGTTVFDSVISVVASTGGACPGGGTVACADGGCPAASIPGAPYIDQGRAGGILSAGTTYFIIAGSFTDATDPDLDLLSIRVDLSPKPVNDSCSSPTTLPFNRVVDGTTAGADNDYQSPDDFACFSGLAQVRTTSQGRDVVYKFTAPADGSYSFRWITDDASAALRLSNNPVLYTSSTCPTSGIVSCLKGANRTTPANGQNRSEEVDCLALTSGQEIYVFFDDTTAGNDGGEFQLEAHACNRETEPNDDTASANPVACYTTGATGVTGDVDFFSLGTPAAGAKVFTALDSVSTGNNDFELRVTTAVDTLQYDDNDGASVIGSNSPVIGGAPTDGTATFVRVNHKATGSPNEPYHLYAVVQAGAPQAESADAHFCSITGIPCNPGLVADGCDPVVDGTCSLGNDSNATADPISAGGYVQGSTETAQDLDCYSFIANIGDDMMMMTDNNPLRTAGGINNVWPILYGTSGNAPPFRLRYTGQVVRNILTPGTGTLVSNTPSITSQFWAVRARYTGAYFVCWYPDSGAPSDPTGTFPLPYAGSIAINCGPVTNASARVADVSVVKTGPASVANTGDIVTYTITVTNNSSEWAQGIDLVDSLPPELFFVDLSVDDDGWDGNNTACASLPTAEINADAPINCTTYAMSPGQVINWTLRARVNPCTPANASIVNTASISTDSTDPNSGNNSSTWTLAGPTTVEGTCNDGNQCTNADHCDGYTCVGTNSTDVCDDDDACTLNDNCNGAGACVGTPAPANYCDDQSVCTTDFCDQALGCVNDPAPAALCDDGLPCTTDACDPVTGCNFPAAPAGTECNDNALCTTNDGCDGAGACVGHNVCDDGNGCTDDYADEFNNCSCDYLPSFEGTPCSDGNACTSGDACNDSAACLPGTLPTDCNDNNPCTNDLCDPALGCINAPVVCDDGDGCTTDSCDPASGCVSAPRNCDDGNVCTTDSCDPATGCVNAPRNCDDGNACTSDSCDPASGGCVYAAINCDDGNCCTIDSCNPASGCVYAPNTTAPVFTAQPSLGVCAMLWPPNHGYADFSVADTGAAASSACGIASIQFNSCSSSQSENSTGTGDGNSTRDCVYEPGAAHLRAERDGACSPLGRDYALTLVAVDVCGNATTSDAVHVGVWHDRGHQPTSGVIYNGNGGTNDTRAGNNGTYGAGCGAGNGACGATGDPHDSSDADPEMEIDQQASISVGNLSLGKAEGGNVQLTWTEPAHQPQINVTRFHIYRLDPVTLFWTQIAEVTKQTTSYLDPLAGGSQMYKVTAVIK